MVLESTVSNPELSEFIHQDPGRELCEFRQPSTCALKRLTEFSVELTEFAAELTEFSLLKQHS